MSHRWVEFTLDIGCKNNCVYCPQQVLLREYYKHDKNRRATINLRNFKALLKNIPKDVIIDFAGFSEPCHNPDFTHMLDYAVEDGRKIYLFTTLSEITEELVTKIAYTPSDVTVIHLPDAEGFTKIKITKQYLQNLALYAAINKSGTQYMCVGEPHEKVKEIIDAEYIRDEKISARLELIDRDALKELKFSTDAPVSWPKETPILCNRRFSNNALEPRPTCAEATIVLPDGTVIPCCMDFELAHPLGNLYYQTYDEIINGKIRMRFEAAMMAKNDDEIICRRCEWARPWCEHKWNGFKHEGIYGE